MTEEADWISTSDVLQAMFGVCVQVSVVVFWLAKFPVISHLWILQPLFPSLIISFICSAQIVTV